MRICYLREALESQNPLPYVQRPSARTVSPSRQALKPIRLKFQGMVPIYLKSQRPKKRRKPRYQYINKN